MTDRKKSLETLLEKVEAGEKLIQPWFFQDAFNNSDHRNCAGEAFTTYHNKSLDSAKDLHDAVLPEWAWALSYSGCDVWPKNAPSRGHSSYSDSPARAWLIAIIKALIAKEQNT